MLGGRRLLGFVLIGLSAAATAGLVAVHGFSFQPANVQARRAEPSANLGEPRRQSVIPTPSGTPGSSSTDATVSPSRTAVPTPVPPPTPARMPAPSPPPTGSWPGPTNTGVPSGTSLTQSGDITVTSPGTVIDAMDVTGCILVEANSVTIERTRVRVGSPTGFCGGQIIQVADGVSGLVIKDVEIDGQDINATYAGIGGGGWTCLRCNVHNVGDGFDAWGAYPVTIRDCWVHDLYVRADLGSHNQDVLTNGFAAGLDIRHNTLENSDSQTATIALFADFSAVQKVTADSNLLNGGGYCIYGAANDGKPYSGLTRNIVFTNNHFGSKFYPKCGFWGPTAYFEPGLPGDVWSGNVWDATNTLVTP